MDFKFLNKLVTGLILVMLLTTGCSDKKKETVENTFYIELVNFSNDSLKRSVEENIIGKVSFYKDDKLEIVSTNYITEEFPKMHYYRSANEIGTSVEVNTRKIRIEFGGDFSKDSIKYSLQKFTFKSGEWIKTSDMGFLTSILSYSKHKQYAYKEYSRRILYDIVGYSYN